MRKLVAFILCILLSAGVWAQTAQISFVEMEFDFGDIPELGGAVQHRFVYTNTGNVPLILNSVHTSCGCTSPAWSKEPVLPSKSGYIDVTFDPRDRVGSFAKSIIVSSNAKEASVTLYISGNVTARPSPISAQYPYSMDDLRLKNTTVNFGKILNTINGTQEIEVMNPSKADIVIEPCKEGMPDFMTVEARPKILTPGSKGVISVTINAAACNVYDYYQQDVYVWVGAQKYPLHVKALITEFFDAKAINAPPEITVLNMQDLDVGQLQQGETAVCKLRFKNTGVSKLSIRTVRNVNPSVSCKVLDKDVEPGDCGMVHIFLDTEGLQGKQTKYITLVTNCPGQPFTILKIVADVIAK